MVGGTVHDSTVGLTDLNACSTGHSLARQRVFQHEVLQRHQIVCAHLHSDLIDELATLQSTQIRCDASLYFVPTNPPQPQHIAKSGRDKERPSSHRQARVAV
jgi:hypothetical protein